MTGLAYWISVKHCVRVLYLFIKSDIVTTIIPTVSDACLLSSYSLILTMSLDHLRCNHRSTLRPQATPQRYILDLPASLTVQRREPVGRPRRRRQEQVLPSYSCGPHQRPGRYHSSLVPNSGMLVALCVI